MNPLLESFLPYTSRHPISEPFDRISPRQPHQRHNIAFEFEMFLRNQLLLRIAGYVFTALLAIGDAILISKVWKALRQPPSATSTKLTVTVLSHWLVR